MAARLARFSGTTAQFWLTLQHQHDLWHAEKALAGVLKLIPAHALPANVKRAIGFSV
jgi:plasmid maintenance system antidote protein VapI